MYQLTKTSSIIVVSFQNISSYLIDLQLKFTIQTQQKQKQLESHAIVVRNRKIKPIVHEPCLTIWWRGEQTQAKIVSLVLLALLRFLTKGS